MNIGAFLILTVIARRGDVGLELEDLGGMARKHPWLSFAMAVFLFSMAGIPPTAGFVAKYKLFYSAIQAGEIVLVVISVLCSAISVYYYLRVLVHMYMKETKEALKESTVRTPLLSGVAVTAMVVLTLQLGLLPKKILDLAREAVTGL